ncbi:MAG: tRNA pseudouridine(38-40) synthase TruA, partial [bacterium]
SAGFHARHSARARRYEYRLLTRPDLLRERFAWAPSELPAREALAAATAPLHGRHDFTAFQAAGNDAAVPECEVVQVRWRDTEDGVALDVTADHFLYHMVRKVVGTALEACATSDPGAYVAAVLGSRDRARVGRMAPPRGLSLERVYYDGEVVP